MPARRRPRGEREPDPSGTAAGRVLTALSTGAERRDGSRSAILAAVVLTALAATTARADPSPALDAIDRGDCKAAGALINEGLSREEAQAYFLAGYLYASTGCVDEDLPRAARLYQRSIELGSDDGRRALGLMYGLGIGVPQDYRVAYRWFTYPIDGAAGKAPRPPMDGPHEIAMGYAYTVQRLAHNRAVYPTAFNRREQGTLYVQFHAATGEVSFATRAGGERRDGERLEHAGSFSSAVARAYAEAVTLAPKPTGITDEDVVFEAPWSFQLR